MSHQTKHKTPFTDPDTLQRAAEALGCTVDRSARDYQGYRGQGFDPGPEHGKIVDRRWPCDFKITVPGAVSEVGVKINDDGEMELSTDWYWGEYHTDYDGSRNSLIDVLGGQYNRLREEYNHQHLIETMMWDGWEEVPIETVEEVQW